MSILGQNLAKLHGYDLYAMTAHCTVREENPQEFVRYLNLSFKRNSGEITELPPEIHWAQDELNIPIAVTNKELGGPLSLEVALPTLLDEVTLPIRTIVLDSLKRFNQQVKE
ncbi:MAG: hypothetical protein FJZ58_04540 [Chlamydiae bacterium]|nr:hypothetical protein [Chlamydiota bacterium]